MYFCYSSNCAFVFNLEYNNIMLSGRRDRSRSHTRDSGWCRDRHQELNKPNVSSIMNQMLIPNMYSQGNLLMPSGVYGNMMIPNAILPGGIMQPPPIDIMSSAGIEIIPQPTIDMSVIGNPQALGTSGTSMDMNLMGGLIMDPTMLSYSNINTDMMQEKKEIVLKYCKLIPPELGTPQPPRRKRPLGCRTIFVGGLPDKMRESIVREIFEPYGRIQILRLSKKNFCHIRFDLESCVDEAMAISGYKIKLLSRDKDKDDENNDEDNSHGTIGWLHVDYACRDDQNEYERRQRHAVRIQNAQMQELTAQHEPNHELNYNRSPSPVKIQPFSNAAIVHLSEGIKSEENFVNSLPTLIAWLERGECSKKYSNQFYSMIQATNSHIRRLFNEKMQAEEELQECRERTKRIFKMLLSSEFNNLKEEFNEKFQSDEMDHNGISNNVEFNSEEMQQLKRENESLQFQLEAYKNEIDVIKNESQKEMEKFKAQFIARQALQNAVVNKVPPLPAPVTKPPPPPPLPDDVEMKLILKDNVATSCGEARLIGVMSAFLQVHPQGASLDYVVSYVRALFPQVSQAAVHYVLQKHTDVFQRATYGVGANIENRWSFTAFGQTK